MKRIYYHPFAAMVCTGLTFSSAVWGMPRLQTDSIRVERLVALGKLWNAVKFFHPFLAYRDIDWDAALIATIPQVNAATSSAEYAAAVQSMLEVSALGFGCMGMATKCNEEMGLSCLLNASFHTPT